MEAEAEGVLRVGGQLDSLSSRMRSFLKGGGREGEEREIIKAHQSLISRTQKSSVLPLSPAEEGSGSPMH